MVKIFRKDLYKFEYNSKGSKGCFKLDSGFLKQNFPQFIQNYLKNVKSVEDQDTELYDNFIVLFDG